jgi:hypothetical protein
MADIQGALAAMLRKMKGPPEKQEGVETRAVKAREGAERISKVIPEGAFPHDALSKKRAYYKAVDDTEDTK